MTIYTASVQESKLYEGQAGQCANTQLKGPSSDHPCCHTTWAIPATPWYSWNVGTPTASFQCLEK